MLGRGRAEIAARQGRWDEFYALVEGELAARRAPGPLVVRNMFPQPRQEVLGRIVAGRLDDRAAQLSPSDADARTMALFLLRHDERRGLFERFSAAHASDRRSMITVQYAKIVCEMACMVEDHDRAEDQLARLNQHGLVDIHWIDHSPILAPLRHGRCFAELQSRAHEQARGLSSAL